MRMCTSFKFTALNERFHETDQPINAVVIPGRRDAASPESIRPDSGYGFRAPSLAGTRDAQRRGDPRSGPGMTNRYAPNLGNVALEVLGFVTR
jgi:hypothetical protein